MKLNLGEALRKVREEKGISMTELAEKTGYTKSFISQVEKNKTSPSLSSFFQIAEALGISPQEILHREDSSENIMLKKNERQVYHHKKSKTKFEFLFTKNPRRKMEPIFLNIKVGGYSDTYSHEGEVFATILQGELELTVGDETYHLKEGDCAYFSTRIKHHWKNSGKKEVIALWVTTPPSF